MINQYRFGGIIIDGQTYRDDVMIFDHEVSEWQRENSHRVAIEDIQAALDRKPKLIIFGAGESGMMEVSSAAQAIIREKGIQFIIKRSPEARKEFNKILEQGKKVVGLFHLTC